VRPPERGGATSKCYAYPSEFLAIASCETIPLAWRELHALAAYTYLRPGELHVLTWADVDLADQKISVSKAWDYDGKCIKSTKTWETREIPIEPNLLPLLQQMKKRAGDDAVLVVPALAQTPPDNVATITREHFKLAGCVRSRLYKQSRSERHIVFRSWRDAGCTWAIVRGDGIERVKGRAGHKEIDTTQRYIVEAENRGATFGAPFPPLPESLLEPTTASKSASKLKVPAWKAAKVLADSSAREGSRTPTPFGGGT
jgi:hypothetical protein